MSNQPKFQKAIADNDENAVKEMIDSGVSVNEPFKNGTTPLVEAAGRPAVVRLLLSAGAKPNVRCTTIDGEYRNPHTPLTWAVALGDSESVKLLLDHGADPNMGNAEERPEPPAPRYPLGSLCGRSDAKRNHEIVEFLIKAGVDVNAGKFASPLMWVCRGDYRLETIQALIDAGADVNLVKPNGTALHEAIEKNCLNIVELLLKNGADPNLRASVSALITSGVSYSRIEGDFTALELAQRLKRKKIVEILTKAVGGAVAKSAVMAWAEIKEQLRKDVPAFHKSLRKGASTDAIGKVEKTLGVSLPKEFKTFLLSNDGQKDGSDGLIALDDGEYCLLALKQIAADWKMLKDLVDLGEFKGKKGNSDKGVRKDWWNVGWIPFAGNGAGDYVCVDTAPTSAGKVGQVISTSHESARRACLAPGLNEFLSEQLERLREAE
jgi:cell wall assembly regulator SMI1/ankyrin repeat protein